MSRNLRNKSLLAACVVLGFVVVPAGAHAALIDLEDLSLGPSSSTASYWNGSDGSGGFTSGGAAFNNAYNSTWGSWSGWSYSNVNNTTTAGYTNQYAAYTGTDAGGSGIYGVAYVGSVRPTIALPDGMGPQSIRVTNATYPALSMLNGDSFAKKFGGTSGDDPDWFKLTITGNDAVGGNPLGSVDFYLADYRFTDNAQDYLLDTWELVDLSSLSTARELVFDLSSSDNGTWGMNTPAYFAVDNLSASPVPEPSALVLWSTGLAVALLLVRRRRKNIREIGEPAPNPLPE